MKTALQKCVVQQQTLDTAAKSVFKQGRLAHDMYVITNDPSKVMYELQEHVMPKSECVGYPVEVGVPVFPSVWW